MGERGGDGQRAILRATRPTTDYSLPLTPMLPTPTVIQVDQEMLFEIILAANYLDIKPLLCVYLPSLASQSPVLTRPLSRAVTSDARLLRT